MSWEPMTYFVARRNGPERVDGFVYRNMAMHRRHLGGWSLIHLSTGHRIAVIRVESFQDAAEFATKIAECGDWDYDGLDGWENRDPYLFSKVKKIADENRAIWVNPMARGDEGMARRVFTLNDNLKSPDDGGAR